MARLDLLQEGDAAFLDHVAMPGTPARKATRCGLNENADG